MDNKYDLWFVNKNEDDVINSFDSYVRDISFLDEISSIEKDELVSDIVNIISKLEQLFILVGCNDLEFKNGRQAWIADKVEYSLNNCSNEDIKLEIQELYSSFIIKRNMLLEGYLKFVINVSKEFYKTCGIPFEDLIQFGNFGLMRAVEKYNYSYGVKFITFANKWIVQSILYSCKRYMYQVRKPSHIFEYNNNRIKAINELSNKLGRMPSDNEIANYMGISLDKIKLIESAFLSMMSIDEELETRYDGVVITLKDLIVDHDVNIENYVLDENLSEELYELLEQFLNLREQVVIKCKYVDEMSNVDIAKILGVTHQRVGQIHYNALAKLGKKSKIRELKKIYFN